MVRVRKSRRGALAGAPSACFLRWKCLRLESELRDQLQISGMAAEGIRGIVELRAAVRSHKGLRARPSGCGGTGVVDGAGRELRMIENVEGLPPGIQTNSDRRT